LILFFLTMLPVYVYLGLRLATHWSHWLVIALIFGGIMSFPFKKFFRFQLHLIYTAMGLLTYLTVFTMLRDLVLFSTGTLYSVNYVLILTVLSLIIGFVNAVTGPRIKRVSVPVINLRPELVGFKIAQISDLHIGATIRRPYVEKVVRKVNKLESDIVVLTGDIGDGKVEHYRSDIAPMGKMKSRYGSFFTPGNHEYYWNVNEWLTVMNNIGIINLVNRGKVIHHDKASVLIAGIPDPVGGVPPDLIGVQDSKSGEKADFRILLSHRPGIAREASKNGFDLQLSGHTHGGQFFPWTLVVKMVHKISQGLHRVGDMWIYVNPGTGSWGPLLRLGTTPEITLLILTQSKSEHKYLA
jgi:uncharacterized protein